VLLLLGFFSLDVAAPLGVVAVASAVFAPADVAVAAASVAAVPCGVSVVWPLPGRGLGHLLLITAATPVLGISYLGIVIILISDA